MRLLNAALPTLAIGLSTPALAEISFVRAGVAENVRGQVDSGFPPLAIDSSTSTTFSSTPITQTVTQDRSSGGASTSGTATGTITLADVRTVTTILDLANTATTVAGGYASSVQSGASGFYEFILSSIAHVTITTVGNYGPDRYGISLYRVNQNNSAEQFYFNDRYSPGTLETDITAGRYYYQVNLTLTTVASAASGAPGVGGSTATSVLLISEAPEPATWGMMILGFGLVGTAARRKSRPAIAPAPLA